MRLVMLNRRMRHLSLWWGRYCVTLVWPLLYARGHVPFFSLTLPRHSGGVFVLRVGPLLFVRGK